MEPSAAERARTAVSVSRVGTLLTYGRAACGGTAPVRTTLVSVEDLGDGGVSVSLRHGSEAAVDLLRRPLATVTVAATGQPATVLAGGSSRLPGRDAEGRLRFRVDPVSVKLGPSPQPVALADYRAAQPDPLAPLSETLVRHVRLAHTDALLACVRSQLDPWALFVLPVSLDRFGLRLTVVSEDGVTDTRLAFPAPVGALGELPAGLRLVLTCPGTCES